jgi:hypothetical protein
MARFLLIIVGKEFLMNILINKVRDMNPILVKKLASMPDISIYLSLSYKDTMRILKETSPEILITDRENTDEMFLTYVLMSFPKVDIYLYDNSKKQGGKGPLLLFPVDSITSLQHNQGKELANQLKSNSQSENNNYGINLTNIIKKRSYR